jgi:hypothetical protein
MTYRKSASHPPPMPTSSRVLIALPFLLIGAFVYWFLPGFGAPDYPKKWSAPKLFTGSKGGCPDLTGSYDGVDETVPSLLQGGPAWRQGGRPWFEHSVLVTQAEDGSSLEMHFALNERGLPEHREHVMTYNQGWPRGGSLTLTRDKDFTCNGRWLHSLRRDDVFVSRNRDGDIIVGETREVSGQFTYGNLSIGPELVDKTMWRRWTPRPSSADAALQAVYTLEVNRFPWTNKGGHEVVVKVGNYLGENICLRVWEANAEHANDRSANASVLAGSASDDADCPPAWLRLSHLGSINFGLRIPDVAYRIAWRPQSTPDAEAKTMDVPRPDQLPLMPDQDDARRKRADKRLTPEQRAQAQARELQRAEQRAREVAEQERRAHARALALAAEAAEPKFASEDTIRQRLGVLKVGDAVITQVRVDTNRVYVSGHAASNALISQLLRAIATTDEKASPDLVSVHQRDGRIHFEMMIKPCALTRQSGAEPSS